MIPLLRDRKWLVMTVVQGILLAVSVVVFGYLGVAMFKPEWF
jgi:K+-transporting ATPase KdpF subunit